MKLVAALFTLFMLPAMAGNQTHNHELCKGFVPENNVRIPANRAWANAPTGITETQFNEVIDKYIKIFEGDYKARGATLKVNRLWTNATVNASAQQLGKVWHINMYGGLARHPEATRDGFALVLCHEGGHHLGGRPKWNSWLGESPMANEGQSDYYGTLKCMRRFLSDELSSYQYQATPENQLAVDKCRAQWADEADQKLCVRSAEAGLALSRLLHALCLTRPPAPDKNACKETAYPTFETVDKSIVASTFDGHPKSQCRLDTYLEGALCEVSASVSVSESDAKAGTCANEDGYKVGIRSLCWYKPGTTVSETVPETAPSASSPVLY